MINTMIVLFNLKLLIPPIAHPPGIGINEETGSLRPEVLSKTRAYSANNALHHYSTQYNNSAVKHSNSDRKFEINDELSIYNSDVYI